ncbi:MAG: TolC family protein, partial [Gammaproteobacteria bacterium]|nr:TolC family protein [Gammaproteobacteria bacterium]
MTKKSFLLACSIAAALAAAVPVRAENLLEVYADAVRSDPLVREAEARRSAALEAKPQARALLLPQVNVAGQLYTANADGESTFPQVNPTTGNIVTVGNKSTTDVSQYWDYRAELTQTIFRWDQWQTLKRADASVAVAEANYRAAQQDLLVRVAQAYFDVLAAEDTLGAAEATLEALTRQLEQADKRFEVGLIAITDVQEARAAHDNARAGVIAAKRAVATAQEVLREITDKDYQSLVKPAEAMPLDKPDPLDEQAWVDLALRDNLNVIAARLGSEVASADVRIAQAGHLPSVDLFAQYSEDSRDATQTNQSFDPTDPLNSGDRV